MLTTGPDGTCLVGGALSEGAAAWRGFGAPMRPVDHAVARLQDERARLEHQVSMLESMVARLGRLTTELDPSQLAQGVVEVAQQLTGAAVAMYVPAEAPGPNRAVVCARPGLLTESPEPAHVPLLAGALWRVTPLRVDDVEQWDPEPLNYGRTAAGGRLRSWLGAPVRSRYGDALGVLFLADPEPGAFGQREEELAQGLGAHLGGTLDNLALFQERARVAGALQQTLLPPVLPDVPGLEIAARYRPAKAVAQVGGDFYDMFELRPGLWGLLLGDVSGVGPEAAALTGIARYATRALATQHLGPAELLSQLNDTLYRFGLQEKFCTAIYAEISSHDGEVHVKMANGGHPYPFLMKADGKVEQVIVRGVLLGQVRQVRLDECEIVLGPGDVMVGYTDGIIEARNPNGEFFDIEGLAAVLPQCAGGHAASVARRIEQAALEFQAGGPPDDMAIMVLQNTSVARAPDRERRKGRLLL